MLLAFPPNDEVSVGGRSWHIAVDDGAFFQLRKLSSLGKQSGQYGGIFT